MRYLAVAAVLLLSASAGAAPPEAGQPPGDEDDRLLVALCLVPEMGLFAELDSWPRCEPAAWTKQAAAADADWKKKNGYIAKLVTPELVRALSGWARPQMKTYQKVPSLAKLELKPVRTNQKQDMLLFEATVDTLPTHSSLVTRWLRFYLLYDVPGKSVVRVIVTIRGQLLE